MQKNYPLALAMLFAICALPSALSQTIQPLVAIHDSELTRALESMNAVPPTPTGTGTTGKQWWPTDWHYFVLPESLKEALSSDGTSYTVIGDSNVTAGILFANGQPRYPIVVSLASEAIRDDEIASFTNYVASGGFLFIGSSAFTRTTNGASRSDFAFANELGLHLLVPGLTNWAANNTFTKTTNQPAHRLVNDIPAGQLTWRMPSSSDEIPWGISPSHPFLAPHDVWQVSAAGATILAQGDTSPFLTVRQYGKGYFIYCSAFQPLIGHSGFAPSMYAYLILRRAVEWAFESANMPIPKLSPWPYQYDAAFMVRHDLENFTNEIAAIEASAQVEFTNGAKGDYYFCTGTLRDDASRAYNTNNIVAGMRRAVTNYGAIIGPHNGGLKNPNNAALVRGQYDYWHWGPDEALDVTPPGYPSGKAYATASISNSFRDVESWLSGITNGVRSWVGCYFNATREDSYDLQSQLNVKIAGDQKLTPFPHWTVSTGTPNKRYAMLSEPVSDWFVGGLVAQSLEPWHPPGVQTSGTLHSAIDFYYGIGGLINFYSHTLSTGLGDAGALVPDYVTYCANTNAHPRNWAANSFLICQWWLQRSNAQISAMCATNGAQTLMNFSIAGATHTNTSVEILVPGTNQICSIQVLTNGVLAGTNIYRVNGKIVKLRVGTTVTNATISYYPVGAPAQIFSQNFDGVTAPALPPGWTTSASGAQTPWVTQSTVRDSTPNAAFSSDAFNIGINELVSRVIALPSGAGAQLSFRNNYDLETGHGTDGYDGGVLEIKIGTNAFTDILAAGGTFNSGGYNSIIDSGYSNPLAGRQAWSGNSGGFITTSVNLPASALAQNIQFRWRCGTDNSNGSTGWRIDTMSLVSQSCLCCAGPATNTPPVLPAQADRTIAAQTTLVVTNTASDPDIPANSLSYALSGPPNSTISANGVISWTPSEAQGPSTNIFTTIVTDNGSPPLSATNAFTVVVTASNTNTPPLITSQPASRTNNAGTTATFNVTATGSSLTYQWQKGTVPITDATNASLILTSVSAADAGGYSVIVTNAFGSVTSSVATLTVIDPPVILSQPISRTNNAGTQASFAVTASGTAPAYQWRKNGNNLSDGGNISGSTTPTLTLGNVSAGDAGNYTVVITNAGGSVTSSVATLTVIVPPSISTQPTNQTLSAGSTASFAVVASGTSPSYQWVKNGTNNLVNSGNVSGATSATLTISNISTLDAGSYTVVITNVAGSVTSSVAMLIVTTNAPGQLFADDFTRGTDPGPLSPWVVQSGTWTVTGGALRTGTNTLRSYAYAYITNSWTNYTLQGQVRFQSGAYGGGLGACVNRTTGAHYGAWVYPEGSGGGSNLLRLVKFQTWTTWGYLGASYTPMAQASLASVGTNWHTLALVCSNNQISVSFDGVPMINMVDAETTPYLNGGISADMWTDARGYLMWADNVTVNALGNGNQSFAVMQSLAAIGAPTIQSITVVNGFATVTWNALSGSIYRLQFKDDLSAAEWADVEGDVEAAGVVASKSDKIGSTTQRFYRVVLLP